LPNEIKGKSNEKGFRIVDTERGITVETKHFSRGSVSEEKSFGLKLKSGAILCVGIIAWITFSLLASLTELPLWATAIAIFFLILFLLLLTVFGPIILFVVRYLFEAWGDKETREWHGCEHKAAVLLFEGMEPTIENLQRISRIQPACGVPWWPGFIQSITTKEPSPEKLHEALELAKEYYSKANMNSDK